MSPVCTQGIAEQPTKHACVFGGRDRGEGPIKGRGTYLGHRHVQDKRKVT